MTLPNPPHPVMFTGEKITKKMPEGTGARFVVRHTKSINQAAADGRKRVGCDGGELEAGKTEGLVNKGGGESGNKSGHWHRNHHDENRK